MTEPFLAAFKLFQSKFRFDGEREKLSERTFRWDLFVDCVTLLWVKWRRRKSEIMAEMLEVIK